MSKCSNPKCDCDDCTCDPCKCAPEYKCPCAPSSKNHEFLTSEWDRKSNWNPDPE